MWLAPMNYDWNPLEYFNICKCVDIHVIPLVAVCMISVVDIVKSVHTNMCFLTRHY